MTVTVVGAASPTATPLAFGIPNLPVVGGFVHLFFARKFIVHRVLGLAYLLQYASVIYLYFFADYERAFLRSPLLVTLPVTGVLQSATAAYYFSFLPKRQADPGYTTATSTLSYNFVKENAFFALMLLFAWLYYNDATFPLIRAAWPIEAAFVFLPYTWRRAFPKTSLRESLVTTATKTKGRALQVFFYIGTWVTKCFYVWAKHYLGFYLSYLRFLGLFTPYIQHELFLLLIFSSSATTIALFLHTLRFKKYLPAPVTFGIYVTSYLATFYSYGRIAFVFAAYPQLALVVLVGLVVNMLDAVYLHTSVLFDLYQVGVMAAAYSGHLPAA